MSGSILKGGTYSKTLATAWVSAALIGSAVEPLVVKLGFQSQASPIQLLVFKLIFGAIFISPIFTKLYWIGFNGLRSFFLASALFILTYLFMFYALTFVTAVVLVTIITTTPAVVALLNQIRGVERLGTKFWFGFACCFVGVVLTIDLFGSSSTLPSAAGLVLAFASVATSALYRTKMDSITKVYKPIVASSYLFIINGALSLFTLPWIGSVSLSTLKFSAWIGFAGAIANVAFLSALHLLGSTRISILTVLQRPLVIVLAAIVLHEPLGLVQILGIVFVLVGVHFAKVKKDILKSKT